jgi:hypothetical protein
MRVVTVEARPEFHLWVEFEDGLAGLIDLSDRLFGSVFEPLRDPSFFAQVTLDEFGAVHWPGGPDLAPDALRAAIAQPVMR